MGRHFELPLFFTSRRDDVECHPQLAEGPPGELALYRALILPMQDAFVECFNGRLWDE